MSLRPLFEWADALPSSIALRESFNAYPLLLTSHVVSMCLFAGLIMLWDFRLVGVALKPSRISDLPTQVFPWALSGFAISFITGGLLLYSKPMTYFGNFYFWFKMLAMALAALNLVWFHYVTEKTIANWDEGKPTPGSAKFAGIASLALWAAVIVTGRLMAYSGLAPKWWDALGIGS
ncbi:MAG: DUF6644 family protein [Acidobacteriota bacterium]|nr:DUF6644 family protein [Acidobacteriota bacterium]